MTATRLQILSTLLVTILLIAFAGYMVRFVPGPNADTLGTVIITAVVAKWLQQGAEQQAERTAEKLQQATRGNGTAEQVNVATENATVIEK